MDGFKQHLESIKSSTRINFAEGCKLWSNDESGIAAAVEAAKSSDVAIVMVSARLIFFTFPKITCRIKVGTWSLDQTLLWTPGTNATTGEHNDLSDLGLVGAQLELVKAVKATGKPTIVVFVSGKPTAEPWIQEREFLNELPPHLSGLTCAQMPTLLFNSSIPVNSEVRYLHINL